MIWTSIQNLLCHEICVYIVTRHLIAFSRLYISHFEQKKKDRTRLFMASEAIWTPPPVLSTSTHFPVHRRVDLSVF